MRRHDRLDEDDVRVRPSRGKSRPRSKDRPEHEQAKPGMVIAVDRGRFTVAMDDDPEDSLYAVKAREIGRKGIVVGDRVEVVGDLHGGVDSPARIVRRGERVNTLRRTADDDDPVERVVVANADDLAIVTATMDPEPSAGLIDRAIVAAYDAGIEPMLIVTKTDLKPSQELERLYQPLGIPIFTVAAGVPDDSLTAYLRDRVTVVIGHSGVGKSTLVNALVPDAQRSTGAVNAVTGKGRHTSTSAVALALPTGGWIIDTPGIRSFGLAHVDVHRVIHAFPDLEPGTAQCPRACSHDEPDCALDDWCRTQPPAVTERLASLRRLLGSRATLPWQQTPGEG